MLLPPDPPKLDKLPTLTGHRMKACGYEWQIEMVGVWPSDDGPHPNLDILCHLHAIGASLVHSMLVEVDRFFLHLPNTSGAIVRALADKLDCSQLPFAAHVEVTWTRA